MDPHSFIARAEAQRWLGIAEKLLMGRDLVGSKTFAIRARESDPRLEPADQILAVADTLLASEKRVGNNNLDWYAILQLVRLTHDSELIAAQYRRLAILLNPHKNRLPFADQAFQLVSDAWSVLSNPLRKSLYDSELGFNPQVNNPIGFSREQQQQQQHQHHHQQQQYQQHNFFSQQEVQVQDHRQFQHQHHQQQQQLQQHNFLSQPNPNPIGSGQGGDPEPQVRPFQIKPHQPQPRAQPQSQPPPQPQQQPQPPPLPRAQPQPQPQQQSRSQPRAQPQPQPQTHPQPQPQAQPLPKPQPRAQPQAQASQPQPSRPQPPQPPQQEQPPQQQQPPQQKQQPPQQKQPPPQQKQPPPQQQQQQPQQKQGQERNAAVQSPRVSNNGVRDEEESEINTTTAPGNNNSPRFWTACPFCYNMYEYPRVYAECILRCENCKRAFQAVVMPSAPQIVDDKEAYYCWGFFPLGVSMAHLDKNKGKGGSGWTPFSQMFIAPQMGNGKEGFGVAAPRKKNNFRRESGPRIYIDDDDVFEGISEPSEDSDVEWGSTRTKRKVKKVKNKTPGRKKVKRAVGVKSKDVGGANEKNVEDGFAVQEGVVAATNVPVAETSKKAAAGNPRRQSGRVAKELGKLDLNVEFNNNEGEEPAPGANAGNRGGHGEDDNIEGIGFFEGLDEFLSSLPILSVVDDKVKAA